MVHKQFKPNLLCITPFWSVLLTCALCASAQVTNIHTTFGSDAGTCVNVSWRGESTEDLEYGTTNTYGQVETATSFSSGGGTQHHADVTGLLPGTKYFYRCGGDTAAVGSFSTGPGGPNEFTFMVPGDIQGSGNKNMRIAAAYVLGKHPDLAFWVPVGDLVGGNGNQQTPWDNWYNALKDLFTTIPVVPLLGNHDMGPYDQETWPQFYLDNFSLPDNGNVTFNGLWYTVEYGDVLIIIMGYYRSSLSFLAGSEEAQTVWLDSILTNNKKTWRLAFLHRPIYSSFRNSDVEDHHPEWNSLWERNDVSVVYSGDTHCFETCVPIRDNKEVASYADGTFYYNTAGLGGSPTAHGNWWSKEYQTTEDVPYIAVVAVRGDSVITTTYDYVDDLIVDRTAVPTRGATHVSSQSGTVMVYGSHNQTTKIVNSFQPFNTYLRTVVTGSIGYDLRGRVIHGKGGGHSGVQDCRKSTAAGMVLLRAVVE